LLQNFFLPPHDQVSRPRVVIAGDIHGQFFDLLELFRRSGEDVHQIHTCLKNQYVFMGDYVDRGYNSVETFELLILLKLKYNSQITLLRGNHESRQITQVYGFYDECVRKYGNGNCWRYCVELFDYLCIAAVVEDSVFCVHGGLAPDLKLIDQIRTIQRVCEIPHEGSFGDLVWSDPDSGVTGWQRNPRGAGWVFGPEPAREWNHVNGMEIIARAHQLVQEGFRYMFDRNIIKTAAAASRNGYSPPVGTASGREQDTSRCSSDGREDSGASTATARTDHDRDAGSRLSPPRNNVKPSGADVDEGAKKNTSPPSSSASGRSSFSKDAASHGGPPRPIDDIGSFDDSPTRSSRHLRTSNGGHNSASLGSTSSTTSGKNKQRGLGLGGASGMSLSWEVEKDYDLVTVWSAPNYCYRCGNVASIMTLDQKMNRKFEIFLEVEASSKATPPRNLVPYFL